MQLIWKLACSEKQKTCAAIKIPHLMSSYCIFKCLKGNHNYASKEFALTHPSSSWLVRTRSAELLEKLCGIVATWDRCFGNKGSSIQGLTFWRRALCFWAVGKGKVVWLKRAEISQVTPKGWRTNDPGAADIPLTWKGGSRVWGCKVLSHLWEMVKGWIFVKFLSSGSCYYKICGNLLFLERLLLSA